MSIIRLIVGMILSFTIGACSSFFGIGGGPLFIPLLIYLLNLEDRIAAGTSLALVIPIGVAGLIGHRYIHNRNFSDFFDAKAFLTLAPASVIGALTGEMVINLILGYRFEISWETAVLTRRLFAVLLLIIGGKMLLWP